MECRGRVGPQEVAGSVLPKRTFKSKKLSPEVREKVSDSCTVSSSGAAGSMMAELLVSKKDPSPSAGGWVGLAGSRRVPVSFGSMGRLG